MRLFKSAREQRNERGTGGEGIKVPDGVLLTDYPQGLCQWLCACVYELRERDGTVSIRLATLEASAIALIAFPGSTCVYVQIDFLANWHGGCIQVGYIMYMYYQAVSFI